jgi:hypothetical protein
LERITGFALKALIVSTTFVALLLTERCNTPSVKATFSEVTAEGDTIDPCYNFYPRNFYAELDKDRDSYLVAISGNHCYVVPFHSGGIPKIK